MESEFICKSIFDCDVERLFAFHESPNGFASLVGADSNVEVIQKPGNIRPGAIAILKVRPFPFFSWTWIAEHLEYSQNERFVDIQKKGPFPFFLHEHLFSPTEGGRSQLEDRIFFEAPIHFLSSPVVLSMLKKQFLKRHEITAKQLSVSWKNVTCGPKDSF
ncbi:SRPBCC family protein [Leptospira stimsonii]|uniref:Cyclase n=1 Tax=Leptospira stimsonii TaxID=2202203 RepID=A0A4R9L8H9_9LEPT|nr:SRPBCC family protein [Leptospira stimsonii]RHX88602.1 hypothetical protein DLM78_06660 [Leptospira stimsonii]TGK22907.1 hypothetical protein EHO98_06420 [Leptospira stimsonii]TGM16659.1 hypothetical protein EHQ90_09845 [Leptospira stimsonii]